MFVLLFSFVFGNVIAVPGGGNYHEYLIGGILVQTLAFGMMGPGVSMATDLGEGIIDRFRSLPMSRPAFLLGHLTAEFAATVLAVAIMVVSGLIVGWGISSTPLEALGRLRPGPAAGDRDDLAGNAGRRHRPDPGRGPGDRLRRGLPADLRRQHVRPGRRPARRAAPVRRIQPGQRLGGGDPDPVRQPDRDPRRLRLAARAPGPRLGALVPGGAGGDGAADAPRLPPPHHRLSGYAAGGAQASSAATRPESIASSRAWWSRRFCSA